MNGNSSVPVDRAGEEADLSGPATSRSSSASASSASPTDGRQRPVRLADDGGTARRRAGSRRDRKSSADDPEPGLERWWRPMPPIVASRQRSARRPVAGTGSTHGETASVRPGGAGVGALPGNAIDGAAGRFGIHRCTFSARRASRQAFSPTSPWPGSQRAPGASRTERCHGPLPVGLVRWLEDGPLPANAIEIAGDDVTPLAHDERRRDLAAAPASRPPEAPRLRRR